jgi:endonuclease-8
MPEGDSVRRTAARLHEALAGRPLVRAELRWGDLGGVDLAGRTVTDVTAYGKHLLAHFAPVPVSDGAPGHGAATAIPAGRAAPGGGRVPRIATAPTAALTLHSHLRMDGKWIVYRTGSRRWPSPSDHRVRAVLGGAEWTAEGHWLGMLDLLPTADEPRLLGHLGPDVMADDFPDRGLPLALQRVSDMPGRHIGAVLLDQTVAAGIGTIYMSESLYVQRISPWVPAGEVDLAALLGIARKQLLRSVQLPVPNTTGDPRRGQEMYVHGRSGRPCRRCGSTIRVAPVGDPPRDRPAFYCPTCQPGPTPTDDGRPRTPLGSAPARPYSLRNNGLWRRG